MTCKANPQHLRLINKLRRIEKYKDGSLCLTVKTWSFSSGNTETTVELWSSELSGYLFKETTMSELERFINSERKKAGIFQEKTKGGKK